MPLIQCPECKEEVSSEAITCPHCGYPIKKLPGKDPSVCSAVSQNAPDWVKFWKKKAIKTKLILLAIFIVSFVPLIVGLSCEINILWAIGMYIPFASLILLLSSLVTVHARTKNVDGNTVLVYRHFYLNKLIVEGVLQESARNRYLNGKLPNGKSIEANISVWDGSVRINVIDK